MAGSVARLHGIAPGTFRFDFGIPTIPAREHVVTAGKIDRLDLSPPDTRVKIRVHPPKRELPEVGLGDSCRLMDGHSFLIQRTKGATPAFLFEPHPYDVFNHINHFNVYQGILDYISVNVSQVRDYRAFPVDLLKQPFSLQLVVNNQLMELKATEPQKTIDIVLKRIDVKDVSVNNGDGRQSVVRGRFTVERRDELGNWLPPLKRFGAGGLNCKGDLIEIPDFSTGFGFDVLPGYYRVVVHYDTVEGAKTVSYEVDLTR